MNDLRPTIVHCDSFQHPLANREFLCPYASVVEVPQDRILSEIGIEIRDDEEALQESIQKEVLPRLKSAASAADGFNATVTAIKSNEAVINRERLEFKDEWYQLS